MVIKQLLDFIISVMDINNGFLIQYGLTPYGQVVFPISFTTISRLTAVPFSKGGYCQCSSCTLTDAYVTNSNTSSNYWIVVGY